MNPSPFKGKIRQRLLAIVYWLAVAGQLPVTIVLFVTAVAGRAAEDCANYLPAPRLHRAWQEARRQEAIEECSPEA